MIEPPVNETLGVPEQAPDTLRPLRVTEIDPPTFSLSVLPLAFSADTASPHSVEKETPVDGGAVVCACSTAPAGASGCTTGTIRARCGVTVTGATPEVVTDVARDVDAV